MLRTASGRVFCCLVLGGYVVSKPVIPPEIRKNRPGRYHAPPKSAMRSINSCQIPVKRKTLNVVDVFVPRLFVVVTFHNPQFYLWVLGPSSSISRSTLKHPTHGEQVPFSKLVQNFSGRVPAFHGPLPCEPANCCQRSPAACASPRFFRRTSAKTETGRLIHTWANKQKAFHRR